LAVKLFPLMATTPVTAPVKLTFKVPPWTLRRALPVTPESIALIVLWPLDTPAARPDVEIEATALFEEDQL
jgi:hypothetical protein